MISQFFILLFGFAVIAAPLVFEADTTKYAEAILGILIIVFSGGSLLAKKPRSRGGELTRFFQKPKSIEKSRESTRG